MKKTLYIFAFCVVIFMSSCEEDDENQDDNGQNFYMRCKIDGQAWEAQTSGFWNAVLNIGFLPALTGYGTDGDSQLTFNFNEDTVDVKSYYFSRWSDTGPDDTIFCSYSPQFFTAPLAIYYVARNGHLTISDINWTDSVAIGTFEFEGEESDNPAAAVDITNGEFRLPVVQY